MKHSDFAILIAIVLVVYFGINFLIFSKIHQALAGFGAVKTVVFIVLLMLILAYPLGRTMEFLSPGFFCKACIYIGSVYLGIMAYAFLLIVAAELVWLLNKLLHFFPSWITQNPQKSLRFAAAILGSILFGTVLVGYINAFFPRVRTLNLHLDQPPGSFDDIRIVAVSDLHLGILMNHLRLKKIVKKINRLDPDLVLFVGDLVDEDAFSNSSMDLTGLLRSIRSRLGVYAVTGNHEYYAGLEKAAAFMNAGNLTLLQDSTVTLSCGLCLIGRKDATAGRMDGGRKTLRELVKDCNGLPMVLMDHQPFGLGKAEKNGIDLQISGHTHHGQLFPFNLITRAVYKLSWGYMKKGHTHYYVSCGAGTWGPPVRTGSVPEIVEINLR